MNSDDIDGAPDQLQRRRHPLDAAFNLVRFAEDRMGVGFDQQFRDYETRKQAAEASREDWKVAVKTAIKSGAPPPPMPSETIEPRAPVRPRIRVADATTEKLGALAASLRRGPLMVRDELSGWIGAFDRYGAGGGSCVRNRDVWRPFLCGRSNEDA
jgi:Protein of unknown function (DUF3987)